MWTEGGRVGTWLLLFQRLSPSLGFSSHKPGQVRTAHRREEALS